MSRQAHGPLLVIHCPPTEAHMLTANQVEPLVSDRARSLLLELIDFLEVIYPTLRGDRPDQVRTMFYLQSQSTTPRSRQTPHNGGSPSLQYWTS